MDMLNPQFEEIGKEFVNHYFQCFNTGRNELAALYKDISMMSFENDQCRGTSQIIERLNKLPQTVVHKCLSLDIQPTPNNGILILVCGDIIIEENKPLKFCRTFHLCPLPSGGYFIFNDLFRFCIS
ncbi:nuclear transport factor 2, putative [Plasmodium relictum]|uniref:Nuclear transport factor 2 n=1 Tax=Plasmodium relictum TaxID=85471 RepID=A0A1J1HEN7_PLARL|nr:nuclear transport factor 2, putative [Plasmodium relictum]CRH04014.1 nuclear transport factor 2, putative [Plasmodium relictum]